jgi:hypothetical protein
VCQCGRRDPEIVSADEVAIPFQVSPDLGMNAGDCLCDRQWFESGQHVLDERAASISAGACRAVNAVKELAHRDDADCALFLADECLEPFCILAPLPPDEDVGVDQDGQAPSGGRTDRRSARTSSAKSSSTCGAARMRSRNRSADSTRAFDGLITATGAPERTTSISSPAATRLRMSENRRATSVALSLVMVQSVSDKSDRARPHLSMGWPTAEAE